MPSAPGVDAPSFTNGPSGRLAVRTSKGDPGRCGVVWLGGFHSDMTGEKATALHRAALADGRAFVRFDYSGHGESAGRFEDGDISAWRADALHVLDRLTTGPQVLVGSSMGGWIALLAALARPERVAGLVLLAPAADFTERLMWDRFDEDARRSIVEDGRRMRPSAYGDPYPITHALIRDGRSWLILDRPIPIEVPIHILQGGADPDVPPDHARRLVDAVTGSDVVFTLIKDGDHRLSRPVDIDRLIAAVRALCVRVDPQAARAAGPTSA
ncbi:alpha/beta fold hydrolase [bacterium]|nr:alpha/beta fold hydrolase [bacterium]